MIARPPVLDPTGAWRATSPAAPPEGTTIHAGPGFHDETWRAMGTDVRVLIRASAAPGRLAQAVAAARAWIDAIARELTRFDPGSPLAQLNAARAADVRVSPILAAAVAAALDAARGTGGLADPTLLDAIEAAGYAGSRDGAAPLPLAEALAAAPARRPAGAGAGWRAVRVDRSAGLVRRSPGSASTWAGSARASRRISPRRRSRAPASLTDRRRRRLRRRHPYGRRAVARPRPRPVHRAARGATAPAGNAVATSGIDARSWAGPDGAPAHHLMDPATGRPAWTGIVSATAIAPTATLAEARAKAALLAGTA
jgi:thiamine biosynthesis lipoprotein